MQKNEEKILKVYFLGSGHLSVPIMQTLTSSKTVKLLGACTQEDRPSGRRRVMTPTPLGKWCDVNGIDIDKTASVNSASFIDVMKSLSPDVLLVASFGQILGSELLSAPRTACVNIHASLLPEYRGAAPVCAAILNGDRVTGVTFMRMDEGLDTGGIYLQIEHPLSGQNRRELELELAELAASKLEETLEKILDGSLAAVPQNNSLATYSPKIRKADGAIDWSESAELIERKTRAFTPWPGAYFNVERGGTLQRVVLSEAEILPAQEQTEPGTVVEADSRAFVVACGNGLISLKRIKPAGKKEMSGIEYLRGCRDIVAGNKQIRNG